MAHYEVTETPLIVLFIVVIAVTLGVVVAEITVSLAVVVVVNRVFFSGI